MIPLLIAEQPVLILPSLARQIGVDKAIILQQVQFLLASPSSYIFNNQPWRNDLGEQCCSLLHHWSTDRIYSLINDLIASRHLIYCPESGLHKYMTINIAGL